MLCQFKLWFVGVLSDKFRGRVGRVVVTGCQVPRRVGKGGFCMGGAELFREMKGERFQCSAG